MTRRVLRRMAYIANVRMPTEKAHGLQISRMCEAFVRLEVETTLVHPRRRQAQGLRDVDPLQYYGVSHPFSIQPLRNIDVVGAEPWLPDRLFTVLHFAHSQLWAAYAAHWAARHLTADLFIARDIAVGAALTRLGLPTVLEIHHAPESQSLRLLKRVAASPSLRALVTMTQALRDTLVLRGVAVPNSLVLHDGVDLCRYDSHSDRSGPNLLPVVMYTGHLFAEKGVETLVEAARQLGPDVLVKIAGGMPQHVADWRARISQSGPGNVEFLGHLAPDRMPPLQKGADLLVLPNSGRHPHSSLYTSPMKVFEYMAAGRPIVASDVPAIREILTHGVNAWLVPPDNPTALAGAIRSLLAQKPIAARLAQQAAIDVRNYGWECRAAALANAAGFTVEPHSTVNV